jgi:hypothetical protein
VCPVVSTVRIQVILNFKYLSSFYGNSFTRGARIAQCYSAGLRAGLSGGFRSRPGLEIFLLTNVSMPALEPTQPPIQWISGALSIGVKRPGREADHSPPSSAEVKNAWNYTSTPPIRLHGVVLS